MEKVRGTGNVEKQAGWAGGWRLQAGGGEGDGPSSGKPPPTSIRRD